MIGKCSEFGGLTDSGMKDDTGLSFYEPWEANLRPDLFFSAPASDPNIATWKRLKTYALYIALPLPSDIDRKKAQHTPYQVINPKTSQWVIAFVVDRGPALSTGRVVDCSKGVLTALRATTDDDLEVKELWATP